MHELRRIVISETLYECSCILIVSFHAEKATKEEFLNACYFWCCMCRRLLKRQGLITSNFCYISLAIYLISEYMKVFSASFVPLSADIFLKLRAEVLRVNNYLSR